MSQQYFGTDGIRGKVGEFPMTPDFVMKLGWAAGVVLAADGTKEVLVGKDTRASGYMLESALEAGLSAAGVNIALAGPIPTPAVAYLASTFRADAGVVISASHNPYYDNGIKFFGRSGAKLGSEQQQAIEEKLQYALENGIDCVDSERLGKARRVEDAAGRYIEFCKGTFSSELSLEGLTIVVDSANGAAYKVAPSVFEELGAKVINIANTPNGININNDCGATSLDSLSKAVTTNKADLGIAVDGDADRIMFVDSQGEVVDGDEILFLMAREAKQAGYKGGVVGTLMSNLGLELALKELDIPFVRTKVGDRYVVEKLKETGWRIGGETSGHILNLDYAFTGDAIIAALQILTVVVKSEYPLHELKSGMTKLPQCMVNVRHSDLDTVLDLDVVKDEVSRVEELLGKDGRLVLRKSGTEPLIRVMIEAKNGETAVALANSLSEVIRAN
ncbi:MAG TPA: phosphoglucosamine mutase [Alteromonas macleodii]|jgi:phosphoglucosamine mutase|uniref:phosphoglucosamine mutase n=1 Tax=Alteromonas australica TaxID=589873 RepID=UPI000EDA1AFB|nr:phosphoglucosamine mutase [Alteromonas australica]HAA98830.1 phosphoglucosamine mutase [Alteromonas macleodii]HAG28691.1 phosphoglucosamine mutase [Alteromonas macleodii]HAM17957.1 phosphoglucosamine mutase [Alteromonas macleodii]|tara:strand:+ start:32197 stop:33537 length:1341 start_codon:yes stop_codon:yes gene_type:complete